MNSPNNGSRNRLLAVLSHADRDLLAPRLEGIELDARQILEVPSDPIGMSISSKVAWSPSSARLSPIIASRSAWLATRA